ncbi:hypothetical protein PFISCL1PPCAC_18841 [Pristionchus fissidentatus]|uniref:G protein-coupled receptor n=1 Tax=Pristionchus fissidentatus TaxID=1538716 RepID=A0AAV5W6F3_9BILA|nr:hypothetical protein PFISCL1PPCAC_18841 [Pristionchus fissidentatus]
MELAHQTRAHLLLGSKAERALPRPGHTLYHFSQSRNLSSTRHLQTVSGSVSLITVHRHVHYIRRFSLHVARLSLQFLCCFTRFCLRWGSERGHQPVFLLSPHFQSFLPNECIRLQSHKTDCDCNDEQQLLHRICHLPHALLPLPLGPNRIDCMLPVPPSPLCHVLRCHHRQRLL